MERKSAKTRYFAVSPNRALVEMGTLLTSSRLTRQSPNRALRRKRYSPNCRSPNRLSPNGRAPNCLSTNSRDTAGNFIVCFAASIPCQSRHLTVRRMRTVSKSATFLATESVNSAPFKRGETEVENFGKE